MKNYLLEHSNEDGSVVPAGMVYWHSHPLPCNIWGLRKMAENREEGHLMAKQQVPNILRHLQRDERPFKLQCGGHGADANCSFLNTHGETSSTTVSGSSSLPVTTSFLPDHFRILYQAHCSNGSWSFHDPHTEETTGAGRGGPAAGRIPPVSSQHAQCKLLPFTT